MREKGRVMGRYTSACFCRSLIKFGSSSQPLQMYGAGLQMYGDVRQMYGARYQMYGAAALLWPFYPERNENPSRECLPLQ